MTDPRPEIRRVIRNHGRLPVDVDSLDDHADLFLAGMTSHASVNVMLALEDASLDRGLERVLATVRDES
jgi:hypothetical protein